MLQQHGKQITHYLNKRNEIYTTIYHIHYNTLDCKCIVKIYVCKHESSCATPKSLYNDYYFNFMYILILFLILIYIIILSSSMYVCMCCIFVSFFIVVLICVFNY